MIKNDLTSWTTLTDESKALNHINISELPSENPDTFDVSLRDLYERALYLHGQAQSHGDETDWICVLEAYSKLLAQDNLKSNNHLKYLILKNTAIAYERLKDLERSIEFCVAASEIEEADISLWLQITRLASLTGRQRLERFSIETILKYHPYHLQGLRLFRNFLQKIGDIQGSSKISSAISERYSYLNLDPFNYVSSCTKLLGEDNDISNEPVELILSVPSWSKLGNLLLESFDKMKSRVRDFNLFRKVRLCYVESDTRNFEGLKRRAEVQLALELSTELSQRSSQCDDFPSPIEINGLHKVDSQSKVIEGRERTSLRIQRLRIEQKKEVFSHHDMLCFNLLKQLLPEEDQDTSLSISFDTSILDGWWPSVPKNSPENEKDSSMSPEIVLERWKLTHNHNCKICSQIGLVLCCDFCPSVYHTTPNCLPKDADVNAPIFICPDCQEEIIDMKEASYYIENRQKCTDGFLPKFCELLSDFKNPQFILTAIEKYLRMIADVSVQEIQCCEPRSILSLGRVVLKLHQAILHCRSPYRFSWNDPFCESCELDRSLMLFELQLALAFHQKSKDGFVLDTTIASLNALRSCVENDLKSNEKETLHIRLLWAFFNFEVLVGSHRNALEHLDTCQNKLEKFNGTEIELPFHEEFKFLNARTIEIVRAKAHQALGNEESKTLFSNAMNDLCQTNAEISIESVIAKLRNVLRQLELVYFSEGSLSVNALEEISKDMQSRSIDISVLLHWQQADSKIHQFIMSRTNVPQNENIETVDEHLKASSHVLEMRSEDESLVSMIVRSALYLKEWDIAISAVTALVVYQIQFQAECNHLEFLCHMLMFVFDSTPAFICSTEIIKQLTSWLALAIYHSTTLDFNIQLLSKVKKCASLLVSKCSDSNKFSLCRDIAKSACIAFLKSSGYAREDCKKRKYLLSYAFKSLQCTSEFLEKSGCNHKHDFSESWSIKCALIQTILPLLRAPNEVTPPKLKPLAVKILTFFVIENSPEVDRKKRFEVAVALHAALAAAKACKESYFLKKVLCSLESIQKCDSDEGSIVEDSMKLAIAQCHRCLYNVSFLSTAEDHGQCVFTVEPFELSADEALALYLHWKPYLKSALRSEVVKVLNLVASCTTFTVPPNTVYGQKIQGFLFDCNVVSLDVPDDIICIIRGPQSFPVFPTNMVPYRELFQSFYRDLADITVASRVGENRRGSELERTVEREKLLQQVMKSYVHALFFTPWCIQVLMGLSNSISSLTRMYLDLFIDTCPTFERAQEYMPKKLNEDESFTSEQLSLSDCSALISHSMLSPDHRKMALMDMISKNIVRGTVSNANNQTRIELLAEENWARITKQAVLTNSVRLMEKCFALWSSAEEFQSKNDQEISESFIQCITLQGLTKYMIARDILRNNHVERDKYRLQAFNLLTWVKNMHATNSNSKISMQWFVPFLLGKLSLKLGHDPKLSLSYLAEACQLVGNGPNTRSIRSSSTGGNGPGIDEWLLSHHRLHTTRAKILLNSVHISDELLSLISMYPYEQKTLTESNETSSTDEIIEDCLAALTECIRRNENFYRAHYSKALIFEKMSDRFEDLKVKHEYMQKASASIFQLFGKRTYQIVGIWLSKSSRDLFTVVLDLRIRKYENLRYKYSTLCLCILFKIRDYDKVLRLLEWSRSSNEEGSFRIWFIHQAAVTLFRIAEVSLAEFSAEEGETKVRATRCLSVSWDAYLGALSVGKIEFRENCTLLSATENALIQGFKVYADSLNKEIVGTPLIFENSLESARNCCNRMWPERQSKGKQSKSMLKRKFVET